MLQMAVVANLRCRSRSCPCNVLWCSLQVKYHVDPAYLKPGEGRLFLEHLSEQILHIDVWDGDSLMLIGSSTVELKVRCLSLSCSLAPALWSSKYAILVSHALWLQHCGAQGMVS